MGAEWAGQYWLATAAVHKAAHGEPERLQHLAKLFEAYREVTPEKLWDNLKYFLDEIVPQAVDQCGGSFHDRSLQFGQL